MIKLLFWLLGKDIGIEGLRREYSRLQKMVAARHRERDKAKLQQELLGQITELRKELGVNT